MEEQLLNLLMYTVPAIVTGAIAYLFFREHMQNEEQRRKYNIVKTLSKEALPVRLQAYERITLFLERISLANLVSRVKPYNDDANDYEALLLRTITEEFEHNLSQQIYITQECWNVVRTAKSATAALIRKTNMSDKVDTSDRLRETILRDLMDTTAPSETALQFIKQEVSEII